jgi:putative ABC transport system substrate-binding protein
VLVGKEKRRLVKGGATVPVKFTSLVPWMKLFVVVLAGAPDTELRFCLKSVEARYREVFCKAVWYRVYTSLRFAIGKMRAFLFLFTNLYIISEDTKMKKIISLILSVALLCTACLVITSCGESTDFTVGICQLMEHDALDASTQGFIDSLTAELEKAGKTVKFDTQVAGDINLCSTVVNTIVAKDVDLILANATPALLAAANATTNNKIPVLGTSVTDYLDTFDGVIPENVSGTSDAVPFNEQASMMISSLGLKSGDKVGVLYCSNESNSIIQYEAVKVEFEKAGIVVEAYTFSETTELQTVATNAANECKAIYIPSDNTVSANEQIVSAVCNDKKTPIYTSYGGSICYASLAIDYYQLGVETGKMAAAILLGNKTPKDIEIATLVPEVTYNEELCELLGIIIPEN